MVQILGRSAKQVAWRLAAFRHSGRPSPWPNPTIDHQGLPARNNSTSAPSPSASASSTSHRALNESLRCISTTSPSFSLTRPSPQNKSIAHHGRHVHCCRQASRLARGMWNSVDCSAIATELLPPTRPALIDSCSLQLAMATLGVTFGIAALSMGGSKKSTAQGPPINASSKEEEAFITYVVQSSSMSVELKSTE